MTNTRPPQYQKEAPHGPIMEAIDQAYAQRMDVLLIVRPDEQQEDAPDGLLVVSTPDRPTGPYVTRMFRFSSMPAT